MREAARPGTEKVASLSSDPTYAFCIFVCLKLNLVGSEKVA
jgi:hypothetical protein